MPTTDHLTVAIQPTQALYDNPWHVQRTMSGGGSIVYECRLVFSLGAWTLFVTIPGSRAPFSEDLKPGDELHVVEHNVGTGIELTGIVQEHVEQSPPFYAKIYSYKSDMLRLTP